jgi:hypothetical protein
MIVKILTAFPALVSESCLKTLTSLVAALVTHPLGVSVHTLFWTVLIVGFGGLGGRARARRRRSVVAAYGLRDLIEGATPEGTCPTRLCWPRESPMTSSDTPL